jgi:hypothetical protein
MPYITHGKRISYQRGCRCELCAAAQKSYASNYWKTRSAQNRKITISRPTAGVMHEFERPAAKSTYIPSNSRGQHQFERIEPEAVPAPDISFAGWAKRRVAARYPAVDLGCVEA